MVNVEAIKSWDDLSAAIEQLHALPTRMEQLEAMRRLRQRAGDLPPDESGEDMKRMTIEVMTWAIDAVAAEVGQ